MGIEVGEVVLQRLQRGDERRARVTAAVGEKGEAPDRGLHHDLPGYEGHGGYHPREVVAAGTVPAAQDADDPHDGDGGHRDHDRFPGQRAVGEERGGQDGSPGPDREQSGQQADSGERLGGVPGQAGDEAEVCGQQQPGQRVPPAVDGEPGAQVAQGADGGDVDGNQHGGDQGVLAKRDQPGERGIADPHVAVGPVHGDAVRGPLEVKRTERQPVEELPVVAVGRRHRHAMRQLSWRGEMPADQDEPADVAARPGLPAGQCEGKRGERGDQGGYRGPVRSGRQRTGRRHAGPGVRAAARDGRGRGRPGGFRAARHDRLRGPRPGRPVFLTRHGAFPHERRPRPTNTAVLLHRAASLPQVTPVRL